ncbi:casein kinase 2 substrate-domain-containing protein [Haematococcus lacustris]
MDMEKLRGLLTKSASLYEQWQGLRAAGVRLLQNALNISERMPALHNLHNYQELPDPSQLQRLLLAKQAQALDNVFQRLHQNIQNMEDVVRGLERQCVDSWAVLHAAKASTEACATLQLGSCTSVACMVECVEDIWYGCRDELAARAASLSTLDPGSPPLLFSAACALYNGAVPCCLAQRPAPQGRPPVHPYKG